MNVERRFFCRNPLIHSGGILKPPEGAEDFTLFFLILGTVFDSKPPRTIAVGSNSKDLKIENILINNF